MFMRIIAVLALILVSAPMAGAARIGDDGLHKEDWFTITFRDIAEDIEAAKARAMSEMRSQVTALAVGAAERIVEQSLDADAQAQLVNNFIDRVGAQN